MEMKNSEVLDRWSILRMKARLDENAKKEFETFQNEFKSICGQISSEKEFDLLECICTLVEANGKIWITESSLRQEYKDDPTNQGVLSLEEIGKRALMIRDFNKLRIKAKNEIDVIFNQIPDVKINHASQ